jgi:hypothetical protein
MNGFGYFIDLREEEHRVELHVLARAYRDAWLAVKQRPPVGPHRLEGLGITIDYMLPEGF